MFEHLSNQNLVKLCISFVILFLLSGCGCIKPEDSSGLREKLDIVSTEQKWVDSGVYISDKIKVTEINIVPNKVNFCSQYKDFAIEPGVRNVTLPFALKAGDAISFSVVGSKMCKNNNGMVTCKKIDENCGEGEKEYFSHVLNQEKCQGEICPNKYEIGNAQWLNGKEYWSSELDQSEREEIRNVIDSIKQQGENVDCSKLSESSASKIDTRILNLLCGRICKFSFGSGEKGCVYIEYNSIEGEIFNTLNSRGESVIAEIIDNVLKEKRVKTDITLLRVHMDNEEFEHIPGGGICINCDHKIDRNHPKPELTFSLGDGKGKGGFNIRVTKNHSLKNNLYIHVSDKFPEHNPGEILGDIPVDISEVHNTEYMERLKKS
ncbi:TrbL/VirB6 plasmid conjugal transfer family protein [Wolbachia endosymbiont wPip_Mol of Culex molestus]|nr:hypothetical protein [Wolbachia endosymbiont of Culex molestus]CQD08334.1 TrbL/VirB6 plasmid conjugal transfer family protein [Wolbachia endosymbiont wPip_Mol of Culex molestus]